MATGDAVTVSDGEGLDYFCTLTLIRDDKCVCKIESYGESKSEPRSKITLFMGYPKGDKLETVVQKAVELGAWRVVPFESSRCIKRPKAEKIEKSTERLNRIALEAAKQSGRGIIPIVSSPVSFDKMIEEAKKCALALFCYEDEHAHTIKDTISGMPCPETIACIVGPEGGFSPEEAERVLKAEISSVSLGGRILRCETAPDFILSALSYEFEL
jgi:16S rRNA (uracil1498-N3)-methyltransferase